MRSRSRLALAAITCLAAAACSATTGPSTTLVEGQAPSTAETADTIETTTLVPVTTEVPAETTTTEPEPSSTLDSSNEDAIVPGENPEIDVIVEAYAIVFDSSTTFEEKAAYIDDPSGLEDTIATYASTGTAVGGVTARADAVTLDGESANVTYTLLFGGNPTYSDLEGTAVLTSDGWKVTRDMFCSVMASARSACPSG